MPLDLNAQYIVNLIKSGKFLSAFPEVTREHVTALENSLLTETDQSFYPKFSIENLSDGISVSNTILTLDNKWGVELSFKKNKFINIPKNIRTFLDRFLIVNGNNLTETIPCVEVDANLNLRGTVGKIGSNLNLGQYNDPVDFIYNPARNEYYIVSKSQHIVHKYNGTTKQFISSLGTGVAGATGLLIDSPNSISFGGNFIFVLCEAGQPVGATDNKGFLSVYNLDGTFKAIPLYHGKNGGDGFCFEGEITAPKDLKIATSEWGEALYILNGTNEIGVFSTAKLSNDNNVELKDVINIPSELGDPSVLGLSRIEINNGLIYITAKNIGKVLCINLKTKKLVGMFGTLSDEVSNESPDTLGFFNGLSGIAILGNEIYVTEELNKRVQVFGKTLIENNMFELLYSEVVLPPNKVIVDITYSLKSSPVENVRIVDIVTKQELTVEQAILRKLKYFKIKVFINPSSFSKKNDGIKLEPVYILCETDY